METRALHNTGQAHPSIQRWKSKWPRALTGYLSPQIIHFRLKKKYNNSLSHFTLSYESEKKEYLYI